MIAQGDIWWADLAEPVGSTPGYRRPVVIVQCDAFNQSRISTIVCVPLTSNLKWQDAPGNVLLSAKATGLDRDSVANISLIFAVDKEQLTEWVGHISDKKMSALFAGIDVLLGR